MRALVHFVSSLGSIVSHVVSDKAIGNVKTAAHFLTLDWALRAQGWSNNLFTSRVLMSSLGGIGSCAN